MEKHPKQPVRVMVGSGRPSRTVPGIQRRSSAASPAPASASKQTQRASSGEHRAPVALVAEFASCVMRKEFARAVHLGDAILALEPNNALVREYRDVLMDSVVLEQLNNDGTTTGEESDESDDSASGSSSNDQDSSESADTNDDDLCSTESDGSHKVYDDDEDEDGSSFSSSDSSLTPSEEEEDSESESLPPETSDNIAKRRARLLKMLENPPP